MQNKLAREKYIHSVNNSSLLFIFASDFFFLNRILNVTNIDTMNMNTHTHAGQIDGVSVWVIGGVLLAVGLCCFATCIAYKCDKERKMQPEIRAVNNNSRIYAKMNDSMDENSMGIRSMSDERAHGNGNDLVDEEVENVNALEVSTSLSLSSSSSSKHDSSALLNDVSLAAKDMKKSEAKINSKEELLNECIFSRAIYFCIHLFLFV